MSKYFEISEKLTIPQQDYFNKINQIIDVLGTDKDEIDARFRFASNILNHGASELMSNKLNIMAEKYHLVLKDGVSRKLKEDVGYDDKSREYDVELISRLENNFLYKTKDYHRHVDVSFVNIKKLRARVRTIMYNIVYQRINVKDADVKVARHIRDSHDFFSIRTHGLLDNDLYLGSVNSRLSGDLDSEDKKTIKGTNEFIQQIIAGGSIPNNSFIPAEENVLESYSRNERDLLDVPNEVRYLPIRSAFSSEANYGYKKNPFFSQPRSNAPGVIGIIKYASIQDCFKVAMYNGIMSAANTQILDLDVAVALGVKLTRLMKMSDDLFFSHAEHEARAKIEVKVKPVAKPESNINDYIDDTSNAKEQATIARE